jgi:hypothetical protein
VLFEIGKTSCAVIAGGRTHKGETGSWAPNAFVYRADGALIESFCLGDDIDVLVAASGDSLWTAYGDEGIYGSHPQSAAGMAGWNRQGRAVWAPEGRLPRWPLAGFSGATEGEHVWLAWYSSPARGETFLTRIVPATGEVESWPSPVSSPDGIAVSGSRAVLTRRTHNKKSAQVTRAELVDDTWTVIDQQQITTPDRIVMRCGQGRDGVLWLRAGDQWLRLTA